MNPIDNNVALDIIIHPKQKQNGEAYKKIIDLDNGLKCILDSLIGVIYHDDKQVKELNVIYGEPMPNGATSINAVKL